MNNSSGITDKSKKSPKLTRDFSCAILEDDKKKCNLDHILVLDYQVCQTLMNLPFSIVFFYLKKHDNSVLSYLDYFSHTVLTTVVSNFLQVFVISGNCTGISH